MIPDTAREATTGQMTAAMTMMTTMMVEIPTMMMKRMTTNFFKNLSVRPRFFWQAFVVYQCKVKTTR